MAKILIVDDDPGMRTMMRMFLNTNGHEVFTAEDGMKALELVKQNGFDLMIADLRMPKMDGMHLLRAVKALDPAMPVILLSAFTSLETAAEAVKIGAIDYIAKPFGISELMAAVGRALDAGNGKTRVTGLSAGSG